MPEKPCTSSPSSRPPWSEASGSDGPAERSCQAGRTRLLCPADLPGVSLAIAASHPAEQPRHVHDSLILGVVTAGVRRITTPSQNVCVPADGVFALPPGLAHACAPENGACSYLAFSMEPPALPPSLAARLAAPTALALPLRIDDAKLAAALAALAEACLEPCGSLERQSLLAEVLERIATLAAGQEQGAQAEEALAGQARPGQEVAKDVEDMHVAAASGAQELMRAVRRAQELLAAGPEAALSLPELAQTCGVDMYALHRAFTRVLGLPPHAFQTHLRLRRAKALLRAGVAPGQAALEAGFCDQSHLNRHFARVVGLTPAQYAKAHAGRK